MKYAGLVLLAHSSHAMNPRLMAVDIVIHLAGAVVGVLVVVILIEVEVVILEAITTARLTCTQTRTRIYEPSGGL